MPAGKRAADIDEAAAEAVLAEARRCIENGDPAQGRRTIGTATAILARAEALGVPDEHPLRPLLLSLQALVGEVRKID